LFGIILVWIENPSIFVKTSIFRAMGVGLLIKKVRFNEISLR